MGQGAAVGRRPPRRSIVALVLERDAQPHPVVLDRSALDRDVLAQHLGDAQVAHRFGGRLDRVARGCLPRLAADPDHLGDPIDTLRHVASSRRWAQSFRSGCAAHSHPARGSTSGGGRYSTVTTILPRTWPLSLSACARGRSPSEKLSAISTRTSLVDTSSAMRASCSALGLITISSARTPRAPACSGGAPAIVTRTPPSRTLASSDSVVAPPTVSNARSTSCTASATSWAV